MKLPFLCLRSDIRLLVIIFLVSGCTGQESRRVPLEEIAANEEVLEFMKSFDGRGAISDSTAPLTPDRSLASFRHPDDINISLVLSEPDITQPLFMDFDHRGRLWVVQYNQYPYPRDLKVTQMDQHIRATFDKVPPPPGQGPRGADKITFFEDTDGDGTYDRSTDAVTGLNIATSVALGRGNIWVLNPPYLLAYADADDNGIPDGQPVVHLEGFGLEDTHAVANSLRWGPDGWLYGAQGSTCTANISSAVSKNIRFDGQAIWRYHPKTKVFEVFAEGGGNTFDLEIDEKGRFYSGDNGASRGQYYKQGAYYERNFGKHGALTNPYAFGYLANMDLVGEKVRFTHAFVKYEGARLPERYAGRMIAINPLQRYVQLSRFEQNGSTFRIIDEQRILKTDDRWFRPVDITTGPDGAVYIVDWYDSRLSHVDPRDTWSKSNGRIYRISDARAAPAVEKFDLNALSNRDLLKLLSHRNRWYRQQVLRVVADRQDITMTAPLKELLENGSGQTALEALWAIHLSNGFDDDVAIAALRHPDPFVRMWSVRLTGDRCDASAVVARELISLAATESHPEVRSQLAASAKRLPASVSLDIIGSLLKHHDDSYDPDIPLQIWWALESKVASDNRAVLQLFEDRAMWSPGIVKGVLLERLMQRYATAADSAAFADCARLIALAPSKEEVKILVNGLQEGLRGRELVELPELLVKVLEPYKNELEGGDLAIGLRQGKAGAIKEALGIVADGSAPVAIRLSYIRAFGEMDRPECVPVLLSIVENNRSSAALKESSLFALQRYDDEMIGDRVARAYPDRLRADPGVRLAALSLFASRPTWAMDLLDAIDRKKLPGEDFVAHTISRNDVPDHIVRQMKMLNDPRVTEISSRIWPEVRFATTSEKTKRIGEVSAILQSAGGNLAAGQKIYAQTCGPCHRLFGEGGTLGPDLTGYDRRNTNDLLLNIVDPNAYVREGYVTYRINTADGRVLSGNVVSREGAAVTIRLLSGGTITLANTEVRDMEEQPSMMPDNLLDPLTEDQIRNLFAFLGK